MFPIGSFQAQLLGVPPSQRFYISLYVGLGVVISVAFNGYVYALRSTEYRAAFKKLLFRHNDVNPTHAMTLKSTKHTNQIVATVQTTKM